MAETRQTSVETTKRHSSVDRLSQDLVRKYTAQPLKFAYYEHFVVTPPMRQSQRASLVNRVLIVLIILASLTLLYYRSGLSFTQADRACIQDEWNGNTSALGTQDLGDEFRISFADVQKTFHWLHLPELADTPEILMIVVSKNDNFARRNTLRKTWMDASKSRMVGERRMKTLFLVGVVTGDTRSEKVVLEEAKTFGDLIVADVEDTYVGLPFKSLSLLLFAAFKSPRTQLIGKIDEDVLFFPDQLYPLLERDVINPNVSAVYGRLYPPGVSVNHAGGKWSVPHASFKCNVFPSYLAGPLYFVTKKAALRILNATKHRKLITVEDVLITGLLAGDVGVEKTHLTHVYNIESATNDREKYEILGWHTSKSNAQYEEAFEEMRFTRCAPCRVTFSSPTSH